jgi:heterodisulfide reductase subunit C
MGMEQELLRDKDIIWQCVSCNQCTYACPRDVNPEGVMKAAAHWLELKGHTDTSSSKHFDEEFTDQVVATGKIEEGRILRGFFRRTKQPLVHDWMIGMVINLLKHFPIKILAAMGLATFVRPRTRNWAPARDAIKEYVTEQNQEHREALSLTELTEIAAHELDHSELSK